MFVLGNRMMSAIEQDACEAMVRQKKMVIALKQDEEKRRNYLR
jgi:hypothetical protein